MRPPRLVSLIFGAGVIGPGAIGCPAALPGGQQIAFRCDTDDECAGGQVCLRELCTSSATDAATGAPDLFDLDRSPGRDRPDDGAAYDAPASDAAAHDRAVNDAAVRDASTSDRVARDGTPTDRIGSDLAGVDQSHAERPAPDALAGDQAAADAESGDRRDAAVDSAAPADASGVDHIDAAADSAARTEAGSGDRADASAPICPGAPPSPPALCNAADPALVACFNFDSDQGIGTAGGVRDGSGYGNHGTAFGVTYLAGHEALAISTAGSGQVQVPDSASIDVSAGLTLEAWIFPNALPSSGRMGVFDKDGQWSMFIYPPDDLRCSRSDTVYGADLRVGAWNHVACVVDDTGVRIYHDGVEVAAETYAIQFNGGSSHVAIGSDAPSGSSFDGRIDSVRIWNSARSANDMCWAAHR